MKPPRRMRVLVVDGDALTRAGILACLRAPRLRCVCLPAENAVQAREACGKQPPELILIDLPLPDGDGLGLLRELARLAPTARLAALGTNGSGTTVERVFAAGAHAFIHRQDAPGSLEEAFTTLLWGERFVSPRAMQLHLATLARRSARLHPRTRRVARAGDAARLSDRELAIFTATGHGHGPSRIARELGIAVKTVETHYRRIKEKLDLRSAEQLHRRAQHWLAVNEVTGGSSL